MVRGRAGVLRGQTVNSWHAALQIVLRQWRDWIVIASVLAGAAAVGVLWQAAPLAAGMPWMLQAAFAIWMLAFLGYALWMARRRFAPEGIRPARVIRSARLWSSLAAAAAVGLLLPWGLMGWAPDLESLPARMATAFVRMLIGWALLSGSLCWLVACLGILSKEDA